MKVLVTDPISDEGVDILRSYAINVSAMHLSRLKPGGQALMILALDEPLPEEQQQQILSLPDVYTVKLVKL